MSYTFFYFGFGSNMLTKRIHMQNPSAVRAGVGRLENYRLDFHTKTQRWLGSPATIVPHQGEQVFGAIWEISMDHVKDLDRQESVDTGMYTAVTLPVWSLLKNEIILCRAYHLTNQPRIPLKNFYYPEVPEDRQPSLTYLKVLVQGAIETGIPQAYIEWLRSIKHNGCLVPEMENALQLHKIL